MTDIAEKWLNISSSSDTNEVSALAGESISDRDIVIMAMNGNSSSLTAGRIYQADTDNVDRSTKVLLVGVATAAATSGNSVTIRTFGKIDGFTGLTAGKVYYVSSTAGGYSDSGGKCFLVGVALSATEIFVLQKTRRIRKTQSFTSSGTFIAPADLVFVTGTGGGGGGGGNEGGGGGGGGFYETDYPVDVTVGESIAVTIGAGGSGGGGSGDGSDGGTTSFGAYLSLPGGLGGKEGGGGLGGNDYIVGGKGGSYYASQDGRSTPFYSGGAGEDKGGGGGAGLFGDGADGGDEDDGENASVNTGAGGGGGGDSNCTGGDGGSGRLDVWWWEEY